MLPPPQPIASRDASLCSPLSCSPYGRGNWGRLRCPPHEGSSPRKGAFGDPPVGRSSIPPAPTSRSDLDPFRTTYLREESRGEGRGGGRGARERGRRGIFSLISLFPHLQGAGAAAPQGGGRRRLQSAMRTAERVWHLYQAGYQPLCQAIWAWHVTGSSYHMRDGDWHASALGESRLPRDPPPSVTLYSKKKKKN